MGWVLTQVLTVVVILSWQGVSGAGERTLSVTVVGFAGLWAGLVGTCVYASRTKGVGFAADFGVRLDPARDLPLGIAAGLASQWVLVPLIYLPFRVDLGGPGRALRDSASGAGIFVLGFLVVVGAPFVEELFFRGLVLRAVTRRFGPVAGIGLSAAAFGLSHFELIQLPALVAFGVVLGILAHRTGRLGPAFVAHVVFNLGAFVVLVVRG